MGKDNEQNERRQTRMQGFDYSTAGAYFVTICTENRKQILSRVVGVGALDDPYNVELLPFGIIADKCLKQLNDFYDHIAVDKYIIMPDHIHIILFVYGNGASRTSPPTRQHSSVPQFISTFKRFCNKEIGANIFQRSYYDHIIRDREDYDDHIRYICGNPHRWYCKHTEPET